MEKWQYLPKSTPLVCDADCLNSVLSKPNSSWWHHQGHKVWCHSWRKLKYSQPPSSYVVVTSLWRSTSCIWLFPTLLLCATVFHLLIIPVFLSLRFLLTSSLSPVLAHLFPLTSWFVLSFRITLQFSWTVLATCCSHFGFWLSAYHHSFVLLPSCFFGCCIRVPFCDNMTPLLSSNSLHFDQAVPCLRSVRMPWKHKKNNNWEIAVVLLIVLI